MSDRAIRLVVFALAVTVSAIAWMLILLLVYAVAKWLGLL